jgi:hypothetical protein
LGIPSWSALGGRAQGIQQGRRCPSAHYTVINIIEELLLVRWRCGWIVSGHDEQL